MKKTIITGTGRFLPDWRVTNQELTKWMDTSDEWIQQRTGIKQRYWTPLEGGVGASDLGVGAAKIAIDRAGWKPKDIDLIIFATLSPDLFFPGSGCLLQHKMGLENTPALDIRQQCTGFLYGLELADAYIKSGLAKRILFVGAEIQSALLDISTRGRDMAVIFGDGAGAACIEGLETEDNVGILGSALHSDGEIAESLMMEAPSCRLKPAIDSKLMEQGRHFPSMNGKLIFKKAVKLLPKVTNEVLSKAGLVLEDIDLFIPHQANIRINQAYARAMKLAEDKIYHNIQDYGNTTAASIPLALDEALEKDQVGKGKTVLFLGLGAGITWGAVIYRFPE